MFVIAPPQKIHRQTYRDNTDAMLLHFITRSIFFIPFWILILFTRVGGMPTKGASYH